MQFQVKVGSHFRDLETVSDDDIGAQLVEFVRQGVPLQQAPPVATIVRPERLDIVSLREVVGHQVHVGRFVASLTRADTGDDVQDPRAIGLMGVVEISPNNDGKRVPMAIVFVEWPDCRWWYWKALVDPSTHTLLEDTVTVQRAVDGDPMPTGLGRWWTVGRRMRSRVRFERWPEPVDEDPVVVH